MTERWRTLKVGDRVRFVKVPGEGNPGYYLHRDTHQVFEHLIARRRVLRVYRIDEWGGPWVRTRIRDEAGVWAEHFLTVTDSDDVWELVSRDTGTEPRWGRER